MSITNRPAWLEIDLNAISKNIGIIQNFVGKQTNVMAIVKANAYGHGLELASKAALKGGAKALGVALPQEGQQLREAGIQAPILILGPILPPDANTLVHNNLSAVVSNKESLQALASAAQSQNTQARIHLKLDTGMGRIGCSFTEGLELIHYMQQHPNVYLEGIMSHIAWENLEDHDKIHTQMLHFQSFLQQCGSIKPHWRHIANSATTLQFTQAHYDLVRVGLLTYGLPPLNTSLPLTPALSLKAQITQIRHLTPGQTLSYGGTFTLTRPSQIALIPLGYADGYNRRLSNCAQVLIHNQRCPVVGSICMDLTLIDVTDVPQAKLADEVILLGASQSDQITPQDLAHWSNTIVHEIISQLSPRLPRHYLQ